MRQLLLAVIALLLFSCQQPASEPQEEMPDSNMEAFEKNVESVKQFFDAFIRKDLTAMRSMVTDDFTISPPSYGVDSLDIDQWQEMEQGYMDNYTDISFEDEQYFAGLDDDQKPNGDVRVYGNWHFTYLGNSQRGALKYYTVLFFNEEGKINAQMEWYDTGDLVPADPQEDSSS